METGTKTEGTEKYCLLTRFFPLLAQPDFLHNLEPPCRVD